MEQMTVTEAAILLGVSRQTIGHHIKRGSLPTEVGVNGVRLVRRDDVLALDRKPGPKASVPRARRLADLILSGVPAEVKVRDGKVLMALDGDDLRKAGFVPEDLVTIDGQHALEALLELVRRGDAAVPLPEDSVLREKVPL